MEAYRRQQQQRYNVVRQQHTQSYNRLLQKKRTSNFGELETQLLIQLWGSPVIQNRLYLTHRKEPVMRLLAHNMQKRGFYRTPDEIKTRIRNLKCLYHRIRRTVHSGSGVGTVDPDWPHYKAMDLILSQHNKAAVTREFYHSSSNGGGDVKTPLEKARHSENLPENGAKVVSMKVPPLCESIKQEVVSEDELEVNDEADAPYGMLAIAESSSGEETQEGDVTPEHSPSTQRKEQPQQPPTAITTLSLPYTTSSASTVSSIVVRRPEDLRSATNPALAKKILSNVTIPIRITTSTAAAAAANTTSAATPTTTTKTTYPFPLLILNNVRTQAALQPAAKNSGGPPTVTSVKMATSVNNNSPPTTLTSAIATAPRLAVATPPPASKTTTDAPSEMLLREILTLQKENLQVERQRLELDRRRLEVEETISARLLQLMPTFSNALMQQHHQELGDYAFEMDKNSLKSRQKRKSSTNLDALLVENKLLKRILGVKTKKNQLQNGNHHHDHNNDDDDCENDNNDVDRSPSPSNERS